MGRIHHLDFMSGANFYICTALQQVVFPFALIKLILHGNTTCLRMLCCFFYTGTVDGFENYLDTKVMHYRSLCYAESTKKTYKSYLASYLNFCNMLNYTAFPTTNIIMSRYIAHLADRLSATSIPKYLAIIRLVHLELGLPNPVEENWAIQSLLKGVKRDLGLTVHRKLPITPALLAGMYRHIDTNNAHDVIFWAACLVGFFGFFRKSNLLPASATSPWP